MNSKLIFLSLICGLVFGGCGIPTITAQPEPTESENPISPAMQTAITKSTQLAQVTLDPKLFPTPTSPLTATPSADWKLVWSEEFDGPDGSPPDPNTWSYDVGGHGWGNNELEFYTNRIENAYQRGGNLIIEARKEDYENRKYTSARLVTKNKADWLYGRFEIRAQVPQGQGIWPAIWMLPSTEVYGGWPKGGEVDIMEFIGSGPETIFGTLHWGEPHQANGKSFSGVQDYSTDFHVYSLEWEPEEFRWFVDDVHYHTVTNWSTSAPKSAFPAPFDQPFHLLINVAVGGNWPGSPDSNTVFPARMLVDYVRVFEK